MCTRRAQCYERARAHARALPSPSASLNRRRPHRPLLVPLSPKAQVRAAVRAHLAQHARSYSGFVHGEAWDAYMARMGDGAWGDHLTLQAFADCFRRTIHLVRELSKEGGARAETNRRAELGASENCDVIYLTG